MPAGRPKGSKTKCPTTKYKLRTRRVKRMHGANCYQKWGKLGGNPILLKQRKRKRKRGQ